MRSQSIYVGLDIGGAHVKAVGIDQYKKIIPCGIKDKGITNLIKIKKKDYSKLGDLLFVSGVLGLSKIGLDNFKTNLKGFSSAKKKYLFPQPRVNLGLCLNKIANSMIDISDGLVQDASHLAKNSRLSIVLDAEKIPLPLFINLKKDMLLDAALYGGDDYELLFSCKPTYENYLKKISLEQNIKLTRIGFFQKFKKEFILFQDQHQSFQNKSYLHF